MTSNLPLLSQRLLALLEEGGEERPNTLLNMAISCHGNDAEQSWFLRELVFLIENNYCLISAGRDPLTRRQLPMSREASVEAATSLQHRLTWNAAGSLWELNEGSLDILLTELGNTKASELLQRSGYHTSPLGIEYLDGEQ